MRFVAVDCGLKETVQTAGSHTSVQKEKDNIVDESTHACIKWEIRECTLLNQHGLIQRYAGAHLQRVNVRG